MVLDTPKIGAFYTAITKQFLGYIFFWSSTVFFHSISFAAVEDFTPSHSTSPSEAISTPSAKDYEKAQKLLLQSDELAKNAITAQDKKQVIWLLNNAALLGHPLAMHNLAVHLNAGKWIEKSSTDAVQWYRKAAEMGFAGSQNNLGDMFERGDGIPQSFGDAIYWYTRAAMQGEPTAYMSLGSMFVKGVGVRRDLIEGYFWLTLAINRLPGKTNRTISRNMLHEIESSMSKEQIAAALDKAKTFRPLIEAGFYIDDPEDPDK